MDASIREAIVAIAQEQGVSLDVASLKPLESHGIMSRVFTASTSQGPAVVNVVIEPLPEQLYQRVPDKIAFVNTLLRHVPQVPHVYAAGNLPSGGYCIIQERKPGNPLGKRIYHGEELVDEFLVGEPKRYLSELQEIVARMHEVCSETYGYFNFSQAPMLGQYAAWEEFLFADLQRNLDKLQASQSQNYFSVLSREFIWRRMNDIVAQHPQCFTIGKAHLIHGDVVNYSNVLVSEHRVEAVVDFEWTLFGHPAWEFAAFTRGFPLERYIPAAMKAGWVKNESDFLQSIGFHRLFWCLWGAAVHADNSQLGPALLGVFLKDLADFERSAA